MQYSCSYSRIYNYLCNQQCLSPLMVWVWISIRARYTTLCDKVCQWLATGRWFFPGSPVSSTNKTDRHDITEILLKMALNTIKQTNKHSSGSYNVISIPKSSKIFYTKHQITLFVLSYYTFFCNLYQILLFSSKCSLPRDLYYIIDELDSYRYQQKYRPSDSNKHVITNLVRTTRFWIKLPVHSKSIHWISKVGLK